jgi:hypothetical protein
VDTAHRLATIEGYQIDGMAALVNERDQEGAAFSDDLDLHAHLKAVGRGGLFGRENAHEYTAPGRRPKGVEQDRARMDFTPNGLTVTLMGVGSQWLAQSGIDEGARSSENAHGGEVNAELWAFGPDRQQVDGVALRVNEGDPIEARFADDLDLYSDSNARSCGRILRSV